jgi:hypothetical protein
MASPHNVHIVRLFWKVTATMKVKVMTNSSTANAFFALAFGFIAWSFCQSEPMEAKADKQQVITIKLCEQKIAVKSGSNRLQFDKKAHVHRFPLHNRQELTLDQGF